MSQYLIKVTDLDQTLFVRLAWQECEQAYRITVESAEGEMIFSNNNEPRLMGDLHANLHILKRLGIKLPENVIEQLLQDGHQRGYWHAVSQFQNSGMALLNVLKTAPVA